MIDVITRLAEIEASLKLGNLNNLVTLETRTMPFFNPVTGNIEYRDVYVYVLSGNGEITLEDVRSLLIAQIDPFSYTYNMTTYKPQEGLSNLDADSHNFSFLSAPTIKISFKF